LQRQQRHGSSRYAGTDARRCSSALGKERLIVRRIIRGSGSIVLVLVIIVSSATGGRSRSLGQQAPRNGICLGVRTGTHPLIGNISHRPRRDRER
jgi:hypothetical protein